ncbi:hypothetical protein [Pedobacter heparinus]|uniref:Nucleotide-diphospho-sugar transferase domain-containing protein n=1 Tax=Pedobacter heparinus (strain ATCC 13125 / DSM 2366 / CIP 104194 / JCM 7457 / NBRC 12017 / NCIMB 9290 / NRRL B-14731 / HIM 762-3) TaxID=485917 RepID=C6XWA1_PEDHD|nr:hypothetical protein [Pedobacter heparinus]ACU04180.1 hypothetical protein Phep_1972 [Pedobacter heparinus DSM 2366]
MKNFVILSYGSETEYRRAIFTILSLFSWTEDYSDKYRVLLYTDRPDFFFSYLAPVSVNYVTLSSEKLKEMMGETGFIHRRKVAVIDSTFENYPGEDLIFVDSDTFFISCPSILMHAFKREESYMHVREFTLKESIGVFANYQMVEFPKSFIQYISETEFLIAGTIEKFNQDDYSWNSGLIGLSSDFAKYMQYVFKLTDLFYSNSKWFISEQLAFSLLLQRQTTIKPTNELLMHYWGKRQKDLIDQLILNLINGTSLQKLNDRQFIRNLTKDWKSKVIEDSLLEQISASFSDRSWYFGFKKIIQLFLNNPKDFLRLSKILKSIYHPIP